MNRPDDLAPLFAGPAEGPGHPVRYRQGVIVTWDPETAENTVLVGGGTLTNVPVLNTSEALLLNPGDVVGLITAGPSWAILGRLTIPGTPDAASALGIITDRLTSESIATSEGTSTGTFTDLGTIGPTLEDITVGNTGKAIVVVSAALTVPAGRAADMGVDVSGPTPESPSAGKALTLASGAGDQESISASRWVLHENLTPGLYTFTAKYRATGGSVTFAERNLAVMPF